MKKKHYPVVVAGVKAALTIDRIGWKTAVLSVKISHRKGQVIDVDCQSKYYNYCDTYSNYTAVRFVLPVEDFINEMYAIKYVCNCIKSVTRYIDPFADEDLYIKELFIALNKA